jgi:hypothetical protein
VPECLTKPQAQHPTATEPGNSPNIYQNGRNITVLFTFPQHESPPHHNRSRERLPDRDRDLGRLPGLRGELADRGYATDGDVACPQPGQNAKRVKMSGRIHKSNGFCRLAIPSVSYRTLWPHYYM